MAARPSRTAPRARSHRLGFWAARLAAVIAAAAALGLPASTAHAGDLPRVVVIPFAPIFDSVQKGLADKTTELLINELKSSEQLDLSALPAQPEAASRPVSPGPARQDEVIAGAKKSLAQADKLAQGLKFEAASDELLAAIGQLESQHPYIEFKDLKDAYLNLAIARFRLRQDGEGEKALSSVIRLDPELKLDGGKFPPVFQRAFEAVAKRHKAQRGSLRVDSRALAGEPLFLDGREVGKVPATVRDLVKGSHFLRIGDGAWADRIEIAPGQETVVAPDAGGGPLGEIQLGLARNSIDGALVAKAIALAQPASPDYLVLGGLHLENEAVVLSAHLVKVAGRKMCALQRVNFDTDLVSASPEIYKVGADVSTKVEIFGDEERLPAKVSRSALPTGRGADGLPTAEARPVEQTPALVKRGTGERAEIVKLDPSASAVRQVSATSGEPDLISEPVGPGEESQRRTKSRWWIWALVGVAVLGGGAAGGYLYYDAANEPVTGNATISW